MFRLCAYLYCYVTARAPDMSRLTWILYEVEFANVLVVDTVLWGILYPMSDAEGKAE